jgi:hypothetical protein
VISSAAVRMSHFRPSSDERDTLKKAVAKYAHDPIKSQLLSRLDAEDADYSPGSEEWNHLQFCVEQHHLHAQAEVRRDPKKKPAKLQLDKADALARRFRPNFS